MVFFELFFEASFIVQLVMISLAILSVYSWTLIIGKYKIIKKRIHEIDFINDKKKKNEDEISIQDWFNLKDQVNDEYFVSIIEKCKVKIKNQKNINSSQAASRVLLIKENMEVLIDREIQSIKKNTAILATIGSVSPYIGLFGTVWGIMNSFIAIGEAKQATLEYVAPGIAEALIATAIGLFAAIPAYIFYNVISNKIDEISEEYDLFKDEFIISTKEIIEKNFEKRSKG
jgi:biopolymer transport protein TolQ